MLNLSYRQMRLVLSTGFALIGLADAAQAQADGADIVAPTVARVYTVPDEPRLAPEAAPGGPLMNRLHERMKRMQATADPVLKQHQQDEFLEALKDGMEALGRPSALSRR